MNPTETQPPPQKPKMRFTNEEQILKRISACERHIRRLNADRSALSREHALLIQIAEKQDFTKDPRYATSAR